MSKSYDYDNLHNNKKSFYEKYWWIPHVISWAALVVAVATAIVPNDSTSFLVTDTVLLLP